MLNRVDKIDRAIKKGRERKKERQRVRGGIGGNRILITWKLRLVTPKNII